MLSCKQPICVKIKLLMHLYWDFLLASMLFGKILNRHVHVFAKYRHRNITGSVFIKYRGIYEQYSYVLQCAQRPQINGYFDMIQGYANNNAKTS